MIGRPFCSRVWTVSSNSKTLSNCLLHRLKYCHPWRSPSLHHHPAVVSALCLSCPPIRFLKTYVIFVELCFKRFKSTVVALSACVWVTPTVVKLCPLLWCGVWPTDRSICGFSTQSLSDSATVLTSSCKSTQVLSEAVSPEQWTHCSQVRV
jgi:hypothetical protein